MKNRRGRNCISLSLNAVISAKRLKVAVFDNPAVISLWNPANIHILSVSETTFSSLIGFILLCGELRGRMHFETESVQGRLRTGGSEHIINIKY